MKTGCFPVRPYHRFLAVVFALFAGWLNATAHAIVWRDDVPESSYTTLAAQPD